LNIIKNPKDAKYNLMYDNNYIHNMNSNKDQDSFLNQIENMKGYNDDDIINKMSNIKLYLIIFNFILTLDSPSNFINNNSHSLKQIINDSGSTVHKKESPNVSNDKENKNVTMPLLRNNINIDVIIL